MSRPRGFGWTDRLTLCVLRSLVAYAVREQRLTREQKRAYAPPIKQGEIVRSLALAEVLASNSSKWKQGQVVHGYNLGWFDVGVVHEDQIVAEAL